MTEPDMIDLLDKVRTRWRDPLTDAEHIAWRNELALVTHDAARQALTTLYIRRPHHRPTIEQFAEAVQTIVDPNRLTDTQIARNLDGVASLRDAWNNRHLDHQETTTA